jgi:predicted Rossmann fold nucleotide-binding protein DprA/Smf involved in DNA uptake
VGLLRFEERENLKKKVLMLAVQSTLPVTANYVSEKMGIPYQTIQGILYELTLEGHLKLQTKGWARYFLPANQELIVRRKKDD